ncbi:Uncharacterised protein [uncultured archaeon]|nr:Uncharacterised protein [uncultured archaeon]
MICMFSEYFKAALEKAVYKTIEDEEPKGEVDPAA